MQQKSCHFVDDTRAPLPPQPVTPAEFARLQQEQRSKCGGSPLHLIDVRTPAEYAGVHAQGARLVPLDMLDPESVPEAREATPDRPLFVICKAGTRAAKAVEKFSAAGFPNVVCVQGGTSAWIEAGLPVVRGTRKVISLERQVRIAAGTIVLSGVLLGWFVHPALFALAAFVGAGLVFAGITDWCGMGMLLARMPWNRRPSAVTACYGTAHEPKHFEETSKS